MIRHISFDFWDTLYKGNPEFHQKRLEFLSSFLKIRDKDLILKTLNETKNTFDKLGEETLCCIDAKTQIWHFLRKLKPQIGLSEVFDVYWKFYDLLYEHQPIPLFVDEFFDQLEEKGVSLSISCNTGLISGDCVHEILRKTQKSKLFSFMLFSDQIGYFKPSPFFANEIKEFPLCRANEFSQILHVGDNLKTDGKLCKFTGMQFLKVEPKKPDFNQILSLLS